MIRPIPSCLADNENRTHLVGLKTYPYNNTLMKVSITFSSGVSKCEIPGMVLMKYLPAGTRCHGDVP